MIDDRRSALMREKYKVLSLLAESLGETGMTEGTYQHVFGAVRDWMEEASYLATGYLLSTENGAKDKYRKPN